MTSKEGLEFLERITEEMENADDPAVYYLLEVKLRLTNVLLGLKKLDSTHNMYMRLVLDDAICMVDETIRKAAAR